MKARVDKISTRPAPGPGLQYAALPFRRDSGVSILLVTSRETGRWVLPKGWPMKGRKPCDAAAQEALEEAGIVGRIESQAIGFYRYDKRLPDGSDRRCVVHVYPLEVEGQRKRWREQGQRTVRWFPVEEAAAAVKEPELQDLIAVFGHHLSAGANEGGSTD
ncbi:NUDIX hydrolase [Phenylobacterium montanum]|uniref:NUDIX hydrolase n=1 Tax=Phenylobacterium montanum TaxID=2823693 RepID=A0A975G245_9CAUL|nr:NUDIX hydrolase [Caulobacter sp. S6]